MFPPHGFRPGDLASIVDHAAGSGTGKGKAAKVGMGKEQGAKAIEGVVWKALEAKIVIAVGRGGAGAGTATGEKGDTDDAGKGEDMEVPERIRLYVLQARQLVPRC